jgi:hypothetical protein
MADDGASCRKKERKRRERAHETGIRVCGRGRVQNMMVAKGERDMVHLELVVFTDHRSLQHTLTAKKRSVIITSTLQRLQQRIPSTLQRNSLQYSTESFPTIKNSLPSFLGRNGLVTLQRWRTLVRTGRWHGINSFYLQNLLCLLLQGFFKGTSADQDRRFSDKELKLLKTMKFPSEFDKKACRC